LLEKTLVYVEGLGRQLDPTLDIWAIGRPMLEQWLRHQIGPEAIFSAIKEHLPSMLERLPELPHWALQVVKQAQAHQQLLTQQQKELKTLVSLILEEKKRHRTNWWLLGTFLGFLLGVLFLYR
jgi:ubiquinone biosynthesis protein